MTSPKEIALLALESGISVLPIKEDGSKAPDLSGWAVYQKRLPTSSEVNAWFSGDRSGLADLGRYRGRARTYFPARRGGRRPLPGGPPRAADDLRLLRGADRPLPERCGRKMGDRIWRMRELPRDEREILVDGYVRVALQGQVKVLPFGKNETRLVEVAREVKSSGTFSYLDHTNPDLNRYLQG